MDRRGRAFRTWGEPGGVPSAGSQGGDRIHPDFVEIPGIVTFVYGEDVVEYMSLYTADGFKGEPIACDEGELEWVDKGRIFSLELWEGDKIFFRLLDEGREFFSLKLVYDTEDILRYAAVDGVPIEL